jgi:rhodanese-related sulfurtransferase
MNRLPLFLGLTATMLGLGGALAAREPVSISAVEVAERIMAREANLAVFDLRAREAFDDLHVPTARHATLGELTRAALPEPSAVVLYADDEARAGLARIVLRARGYHAVVLRGGLHEWIARVREPRLAVDATAQERAEFARAVVLSRFFGGLPIAGVPRAELLLATTVRRRGC